MRPAWIRFVSVPLLAVAAAASLAGGCSERPRLAGSFDVPAPAGDRVLKVSGTGRMSLPPSKVSFDCVVTVRAPSPEAAWSQGSVRITKLAKALEQAGVSASDQVMHDIQLQAWTPAGPEAWMLIQKLTISLNELQRLPPLLTVVLGAGADTIENAIFGIGDTRTAGDRARERALIDARTKAEMIAQEVNLRLGAVRSVEEQEFTASASGALDAPGAFEVVTKIEVTYELID